ncbi:hypothetical protein GCM10008929_00150 [Alkalibacterium psychrotolerans]
MRIVLAIVIGIVILNTGLAYYIVFSEDRRDTAASWAWLLALILFPGFGIVAFCSLEENCLASLFLIRKFWKTRAHHNL